MYKQRPLIQEFCICYSQWWSFLSYSVIFLVVTLPRVDTWTGNLSVFDFSLLPILKSNPAPSPIDFTLKIFPIPPAIALVLTLSSEIEWRKNLASGARPDWGTWYCHPLDLWPQASDWTFQSLTFLTQAVRLVLVSTLWDCLEIKWGITGAQC